MSQKTVTTDTKTSDDERLRNQITLNQALISALREADPDHPLLHGAPGTNQPPREERPQAAQLASLENCPFCKTAVPEGASVCAGCGATRYWLEVQKVPSNIIWWLLAIGTLVGATQSTGFISFFFWIAFAVACYLLWIFVSDAISTINSNRDRPKVEWRRPMY